MNKNTGKLRIQVLGTSIFLMLSKKEMQKWNPENRKYFFVDLEDKEFCKKILKQTEKTEEELEFIKKRSRELGWNRFECNITVPIEQSILFKN